MRIAMRIVSLSKQRLLDKYGLLDKRGFSLVEMLVVLLIMSVIMVATTSLFVTAKRSTVVQSDLASVEGGMRVVLERMSKDFRNAGFLSTLNPVTGYTDVSTTPNETVVVDASSQPLTINTRAVSGVFGRVSAVPTTTAVGAANTTNAFSLVYPEQFRHFPSGAYAAVVEPVSGVPIGDVYYVMSSSSGLVKLGDKTSHNELAGVGAFTGAPAGLVLLRAPTVNLSDLDRTITYELDGDTLIRRVDGGTEQYLANGLSDLTFTVEEDDDGDVHKVLIQMTGETVEASKNDVAGSAKTKQMSITVSLRNI
jgi:prepilin-type N-terminal cleavage/methylation domain-containing protein